MADWSVHVFVWVQNTLLLHGHMIKSCYWRGVSAKCICGYTRVFSQYISNLEFQENNFIALENENVLQKVSAWLLELGIFFQQRVIGDNFDHFCCFEEGEACKMSGQLSKRQDTANDKR